ncbi:metallophosphoesterase family protein [Cohnella lupini]|uniref:3',5'-cyclic AMP phosphodiesterase CpdA n=1 Tax=Cohnella lupini TaxID=1294267 RepID=A0A3D9IP53_9BACL|nr:metallophosphoesterase [Cohnella lupini]RED63289.1 3',5'-cyclic AMP phosphodiesterase CpdA [Cohnella lupini]
MKSVQFVQITDPHMNAPGQNYSSVSMTDKLKLVFQDVKTSGFSPAFVVITGDLAFDGNEADYAYIRKLVDEGSALVDAPVHVILGNHDRRSPFREGYLGETPSERPYYYSTTIGGMRLIGLDSEVPGETSGFGLIDREQLDWLAEEMKTTAPHGTVIAVHHPMLRVNDIGAKYNLRNAEEVSKVLKTGRDIIGVFAGHVHSNNVGLYDGILNIAASGSAYIGKRIGDGIAAGYNFCSYNLVTVTDLQATVQTIILPTPNEELFRVELSRFAD